MEILKWYGRILVGLTMLLDFICMVFKVNVNDKLGHLLSIILHTPIFMYLLLS